MNGKFKNWFESQYGKPVKETAKELSDELVKLQIAVFNAKDKLNVRKLYDDRWDAALKAWQAKEKV